MFYPVRDYNPLTRIPFQYVTIALIVLNVIVFVLTQYRLDFHTAASFALVPGELFDEGLLGAAKSGQRFDAFPLPERWTLLSYMFLHGDILHLAGNMLFLWVFGDNVEDALGHVRFLVFYLLCGVAGGLMHAWMAPTSGVPLIGASGAIAGVVAAYLILHPRVNMWVLVARIIPLKIPASWALGAWIAMQFVLAFTSTSAPVAWWAHVGGLIAGAVLVVILRRPGVKLFDQSTTGT